MNGERRKVSEGPMRGRPDLLENYSLTEKQEGLDGRMEKLEIDLLHPNACMILYSLWLEELSLEVIDPDVPLQSIAFVRASVGRS